MGPMLPPNPVRPERLIVIQTEGWKNLDTDTISAFEQLMNKLKSTGVTLLRRTDHPWIESFEKSISNAAEVCSLITAWENRWFQRNLLDRSPDGVSARTQATLATAEAMIPDDYNSLVLARETARIFHTTLAPLADAVTTLACPGPAPYWPGDILGEPLDPRPTGDAAFNYPSSRIGAPVVTVPIMAVHGMPVGLQIMGQRNEDARITAISRWVDANVVPVVIKMA